MSSQIIPATNDEPPPHTDADAPASKPKQADLLIAIATGKSALWQDPSGREYSSLTAGAHTENHRVRSRGYRKWIISQYYNRHKSAPSSQAMEEALRVIEAIASNEGETHDVHIRVAGHGDCVYIDRCDPAWSAIEIDASGWRVVANPPVKFRRAAGMLALPMPFQGGALDELRNLRKFSDDNWALIASWIVSAARPDGSYALLSLTGEQGSGKSTIARQIRSVIDPHEVAQRSLPRNEEDLAISAAGGRILSYENLSTIRGYMSDALCAVATGGGYGSRTLYTNDDETLFSFRRPILMNSITGAITRADLMDRTLCVEIDQLPRQRHTDQDIAQAYAEMWPRLVGGLCAAVSTALARRDSMPASQTRMADHDLWSRAAEPALGLKTGAYSRSVTTNRERLVADSIDACPVASAIAAMDLAAPWVGTMAALDAKIRPETRGTDWPRTTRAVGAAVRRAIPALREIKIGIAAPSGATNRGRQYTISQIGYGSNGHDGHDGHIAEHEAPTDRSGHDHRHDRTDLDGHGASAEPDHDHRISNGHAYGHGPNDEYEPNTTRHDRHDRHDRTNTTQSVKGGADGIVSVPDTTAVSQPPGGYSATQPKYPAPQEDKPETTPPDSEKRTAI